MKESTQNKPRVLNKAYAKRPAPPLIAADSEAVLPILQMLENARLCLGNLPSDLSRGFIEEWLMLPARTVAGEKHRGRQEGASHALV